MTTFSLLDTSLAATLVTDRRGRFERTAHDHRAIRLAARLRRQRPDVPGRDRRLDGVVLALPASSTVTRSTETITGSLPADRVA